MRLRPELAEKLIFSFNLLDLPLILVIGTPSKVINTKRSDCRQTSAKKERNNLPATKFKSFFKLRFDFVTVYSAISGYL